MPVNQYAIGVQPLPAKPLSLDPECLVCGNKVATELFSIDLDDLKIIGCSVCGLGRLHPLPSLEQIGSYYPAEYYGHAGKKFIGPVERLVRWVGQRHANFLSRQTPPGGRILDIGCGRGVTARALADTGFEAHGFEVSSSALEGIDPRVQVRVATDLEAASYPENFFDEVIIWHVLEHVRDPQRVLMEIFRILKPGGSLVVAVPNFSSWQARWAGASWFHLDPPRHIYHFSANALRRLMQQAGFGLQSEHHFSLRQNPFGWVQSALNKLNWSERNALYTQLHFRNPNPLSTPRSNSRLQLLIFALLAGPALLLSILAALAGQGATIHIVARKN